MRNVSYCIILVIFAIIISGCSSAGSDPVSPVSEPDSQQQLTAQTGQSVQTPNTVLWGYYDIYLDVQSKSVEITPNRNVSFAANIVGFLNLNPIGLGISFNGTSMGSGYIDIDLDVTINHPLDKETFNGYDVMGVFIGDGSGIMDYNSDLVYPIHGTDQILLNADSYTRWFSPNEFTTSGLFGYIPGNLASPGYSGTATLNGCKYFGEGLGASDDLWTYLETGADNTGYFLHGTGNTRNYQIRFPIPQPGIKYGYAVVANWAGTGPDDHPAHAAEAVGCSVDDTSTVYYVDETDSGGDLIMDISVFEWDAELTGGVMLDYIIYIESTVLLSEYTLNTSEMTPTGSGDNWNTFHVQIPADSVLSTASNELWVIVEDADADYTNPFGVPNVADNDPLAACFRFPLDVGSEPVPWIQVTSPNGGETWDIGGDYDITWEASPYIDNVAIELSLNSGGDYTMSLTPSAPNTGLFEWNPIPPEAASENCRIKVMDAEDSEVWDQSDADFTVTTPWIEVTSPNGGESWKVLSDHEITWDSSESTGEVKIEYSKNYFVSDINLIVDTTPNDGSYMWVDIPYDLSDTVKVRVSSTVPSMSDISDAVFSIIEPDEYITVLSPNGGEEWQRWNNHEITWESSGVTGNVNIYCSSDNFVSDIYTIAENEPNTLSYMWENISVAPSDTMRVKVECYDYPFINDISDADFSIWDAGWGLDWGGPTYEYDEGYAVATDNDGNVYATGIFWGTVDFDPDPIDEYPLTSNGGYEAYLSKFDSSGNFIWARAWGGTGFDFSEDVTVDGYGNVYVTGSFNKTVDFDPDPVSEYPLTSIGSDDGYLLKLDSSGNFVWAGAWGGTSGDYGAGVVVDNFGNVYVTGSFVNTVDFDPDPVSEYPVTSTGSDDAYLIKLDSSDNFVWVRNWGGSSSEYGCGVAVDSTGNVYVTGNFWETADFDPDPIDEYPLTPLGGMDGFLSKFDPSGDFVWAGAWGGLLFENSQGVAVDGFGNAYVTGYFSGTADFDPDPIDEFLLDSIGSNDAFLSKIDSSGNFVWAGAWGGTSNDSARDVTLDSEGNVFVAGYFNATVDFDPDLIDEFPLTSSGETDAFLSKFDGAGNFEWVRTVGDSLYEGANGVAVDGFGNIFTTGYFESTSVDLAPSDAPCFEDPDLHYQINCTDIFLIKYLPNGCW